MSKVSLKNRPVGSSSTLATIEAQVASLSRQEKLLLVEDLIRQVRLTEPSPKESVDWSGAYGIASGLWPPGESTAYVKRLRDEWEL